MIKIIFVLVLFCGKTALTQTTTTTIVYDNTSNLSITACNVFAYTSPDPPISVGGKLHTGVIGEAKYSATNGLVLPTNYTFSSGHVNRTDYRISYPFKSGYIYSIEITAFGDASISSTYPSIGTNLYTSSGLTFTSTSCGAGDKQGFGPQGSLFSITVNGTSKAYSPQGANFTSPNDFDYLLLEATCFAAQNITANAYIQKIKIIETPPISFTIPATTIFACGSTTAINFSAANVYNTTGITNYTWSLGAIPNGWLLPNGTPAPATYSTGIANTLTLTPDCGSV